MAQSKLEALKQQNFYEVLNVPLDASTEQIKESYKEIARIYHPDSNFYADIINVPLTRDEEEIFKLITSAYNILINPDKRAEYDKLIPKGLRGWDEQDYQTEEPKKTKIFETNIPSENIQSVATQMDRIRQMQQEALKQGASLQRSSPVKADKASSSRASQQIVMTLLFGAAAGLVSGILLFLML